jgi:hypothetical protein
MFKDLHINTEEQLKRDEARAKAFKKPEPPAKPCKSEPTKNSPTKS